MVSLDKLKKECKRIRSERERIERDNIALEKRITEATELVLDNERPERVFEVISHNLVNFTFEEKRQTSGNVYFGQCCNTMSTKVFRSRWHCGSGLTTKS